MVANNPLPKAPNQGTTGHLPDTGMTHHLIGHGALEGSSAGERCEVTVGQTSEAVRIVDKRSAETFPHDSLNIPSGKSRPACR